MSTKNDISKSICKNCEFRFRRVFIPSNTEGFIDQDGDPVEQEEDSIVIMNMCLAADMDLDLDVTIECTHYRPKGEKDLSFFRHFM